MKTEKYDFDARPNTIRDDFALLESYEQYRLKSNSELVETDQESEQSEPNKSLDTAFRKLLLIRFMQRAELFPKKQSHMDQKQELEFIGELTGLSYEANLKKVHREVEKLLDRPRDFSPAQLKPRLNDLRAVKTVALGMELAGVVANIEKYESDFIKIIGSE